MTMCKHPECTKQPVYGKSGTKLAEYCKTHAPVDYENVISKRCNHPECTTKAGYGPLFKQKTHCSQHRTLNEYKNNNPSCSECKNMPLYTDKKDNYPIRCEEHKKDNDKNVIEKECSSCKLSAIINEEIGQCNDCYEFFTEKKTKRKEIKIKEMLDNHNIKYDSHDKIYSGSCLRYRPDFIFECPTHVIVFEVDEYQHSRYECSCEQIRMINLCQDFGGTPVVFIRFNPDSYKIKGKSIPGSINKRSRVVIDTIKKIKMYKPDSLLSVIYLYYDDFDEKKIDIIKIDVGSVI